MTTKKTALITGANKGIGFETARQLLQLGYFVFIGSRDRERGLKAVEELKKTGFNDIDLLEIDVTNLLSVQHAREELGAKISKLDVLINNAGITGEMPQNASSISLDNLRTVYETNFFGVIQVTQHFLDLMKKSDEPRIVNVSSDLGSLTNHSNPDYEFYDVKLTAYCSSKTAVNTFTVMLAYELKNTHFKINSVNPGFTATDLNGYTGYQTVEQGTKAIVKYATIDQDGPSGKFFGDGLEIAW
ncbi:SDR family oxidoreductase [Chryseobacterium sp. OV279]|uniref:SDR family oxidoreductase n=1 Tax=Chryseobacterium sp. OV279 TaxID=1500285 RepID=UPI0009221559|nr:SDR family oxidoreductase [Chryseobacterium sp. OV279]SHG06969.1 NAD(P)-dependent dehydrogenase, short-chain alcohol dehydrogenase family [Chryseobacterium sp. OV279]